MVSLVGLSLFLLVAVVVSSVVFGARALPCSVDTESRTSLLLAKASTWFSPSAARHRFAGHATRRAGVLLGLAPD